jgi:hypothetical protein
MKAKNGFYRITESSVILNKSKAGLDITGKHKLVFKSAISAGNDDTNNGKASEVKTMSEESKKDTSKTADNASGTTFTPEGPTPKMTPNNSVNTVDVSGVTATANATNVSKNPNYEYDSLGNLKGVDVPEYNRITEEDDLSVRKAKIEAQQKSLPSPAPQPKVA